MVVRTKDAANIGKTTYRAWIREYNQAREDWFDILNHDGENYEECETAIRECGKGEYADITEVRWDYSAIYDEEYGKVIDADQIELRRWYFYRDAGTEKWELESPDGERLL